MTKKRKKLVVSGMSSDHHDAIKEEYPGKDSMDEIYFLWYCVELVAHGYLNKFEYHGEVFTIFEPVRRSYMKKTISKVQKKVSVKEDSYALISGKTTYEVDFTLYWNEDKAKGVFFGIPTYAYVSDKPFPFEAEWKDVGKDGFLNLQLISRIDVKGGVNAGKSKKNNSATTFPLKQKALWYLHGIYIQKIQFAKLFPATFTPWLFKHQWVSKKPRKFNYEAIGIEEYVESKESINGLFY